MQRRLIRVVPLQATPVCGHEAHLRLQSREERSISFIRKGIQYMGIYESHGCKICDERQIRWIKKEADKDSKLENPIFRPCYQPTNDEVNEALKNSWNSKENINHLVNQLNKLAKQFKKERKKVKK